MNKKMRCLVTRVFEEDGVQLTEQYLTTAKNRAEVVESILEDMGIVVEWVPITPKKEIALK